MNIKRFWRDNGEEIRELLTTLAVIPLSLYTLWSVQIMGFEAIFVWIAVLAFSLSAWALNDIRKQQIRREEQLRREVEHDEWLMDLHTNINEERFAIEMREREKERRMGGPIRVGHHPVRWGVAAHPEIWPLEDEIEPIEEDIEDEAPVDEWEHLEDEQVVRI